MGAGLQCWDENGNLVLSLPDRLSRVLGIYTIPAGATGYITNADFSMGQIWWYCITGASIVGAYVPTITIEAANNRIKYEPKHNTTPGMADATIIYGVF